MPKIRRDRWRETGARIAPEVWDLSQNSRALHDTFMLIISFASRRLSRPHRDCSSRLRLGSRWAWVRTVSGTHEQGGLGQGLQHL